MDSPGSVALAVFVFTLVWVVIFLVCREIVCWYFKINRLLKSVEQIERIGEGINANGKQLETISTLLREVKEAAVAANARQAKALSESLPAQTVSCPCCNKTTRLKDDPLLGNLQICQHCGESFQVE